MLIQIKGSEYEVSQAQITEARDWVCDCLGGWTDLEDEDDVDELSDRDVMVGVNRSYDGGINQFLADCV